MPSTTLRQYLRWEKLNSYQFLGETPWILSFHSEKSNLVLANLDHPKQLQKALLEQEGIEVTSDFMINLEKYGWYG